MVAATWNFTVSYLGGDVAWGYKDHGNGNGVQSRVMGKQRAVSISQDRYKENGVKNRKTIKVVEQRL